jgi:PAS domain S-box-containing protein
VIKYQSESLERSLGYSITETIGKHFFELGFIHPDDTATNKELFEQAIQNPGKNIRGQIRLRHKNGTYKTMEVIFRNMLAMKHKRHHRQLPGYFRLIPRAAACTLSIIISEFFDLGILGFN